MYLPVPASADLLDLEPLELLHQTRLLVSRKDPLRHHKQHIVLLVEMSVQQFRIGARGTRPTASAALHDQPVVVCCLGHLTDQLSALLMLSEHHSQRPAG